MFHKFASSLPHANLCNTNFSVCADETILKIQSIEKLKYQLQVKWRRRSWGHINELNLHLQQIGTIMPKFPKSNKQTKSFQHLRAIDVTSTRCKILESNKNRDQVIGEGKGGARESGQFNAFCTIVFFFQIYIHILT